MPFDLSSHLGRWTDHFANKSLFGRIVTNPIWLSCIIVMTTLLIIYIIGYDDGPTFRLLFYLFTVTLGLITVHDQLFKSQITETFETDAAETVVTDIAELERETPSPVQPRQAEQAAQSFMKSAIESRHIDNTDDLYKLIDST